MIGMRTFGASAPLKDVQRKFGFTPESIGVEVCMSSSARSRERPGRSLIQEEWR
jgi:hypothetical protein